MGLKVGLIMGRCQKLTLKNFLKVKRAFRYNDLHIWELRLWWEKMVNASTEGFVGLGVSKITGLYKKWNWKLFSHYMADLTQLFLDK